VRQASGYCVKDGDLYRRPFSRHLYQLNLLLSTDIKLSHNVVPLLRHDIKMA
jgi:hypothetical protein